MNPDFGKLSRVTQPVNKTRKRFVDDG
jgi:hypothetical protein